MTGKTPVGWRVKALAAGVLFLDKKLNEDKMHSEPWNTISFILWFSMVLLLLIDAGLWLSWNESYYTKGLALFSKQVSVVPLMRDADIHEFVTYIKPTRWGSKWLFSELAPNTYGFREKYPRLGLYMPVMHGLLIFDYEHRQVIVKGFVNGGILIFAIVFTGVTALAWIQDITAFWTSGTINPDHLLYNFAFIGLPALMFGVSYIIQAHRFKNAVDAAVWYWSGGR